MSKYMYCRLMDLDDEITRMLLMPQRREITIDELKRVKKECFRKFMEQTAELLIKGNFYYLDKDDKIIITRPGKGVDTE